MGARLAGSANRPALAHALATAGIARAATLADAWDAWIAAPAHLINTADPPAAGAPPVVSPLACGADLLRWIRAHWTGGPLVLGLDASHRRADVVLLRMSVLYRGTALPVAWVIVPANQPGAWEPHWERMLRWARSALPLDQEVLTLADQGVWSPRLWHAIRSQQFHPIMRVRPTSTFAPTGQVRQSVLVLVLALATLITRCLGEEAAQTILNPPPRAGRRRPWHARDSLLRVGRDRRWQRLWQDEPLPSPGSWSTSMHHIGRPRVGSPPDPPPPRCTALAGSASVSTCGSQSKETACM